MASLSSLSPNDSPGLLYLKGTLCFSVERDEDGKERFEKKIGEVLVLACHQRSITQVRYNLCL